MKKFLILLLLCLIISGCTIKEDNKEKPKDYTEEITNLLKRSYTYSLYAYGKLEYEEASATLENKKYNLIKNDEIKSINDLNDLIDETFVSERKENFYTLLFEQNEFIEIDNKLYIKRNIESCDIGKDIDFNNFVITLQEKEQMKVKIDDFEYYVYIRDEKLYLDTDTFKCLDAKKELIDNFD